MRKIGFTLLALSLVFGALALWALKSVSGPPAVAAVAPAIPRTIVITASKPIGLGQPLTADVLRAQPWPEGAAPPGAFRTIAELTAGGPRYALAPIVANEVILPRRISGAGGRVTLAAAIRAGMRASTMRVDDVMGVAGFVLPGDFVDVIVTRRSGDQTSAMRSDVLVEAVRVLAVDQIANEVKNDPVVAKAATIEVTPAQAQKLALAGQVGTLSLALRSADEPFARDRRIRPRTIDESDLRLDGGGSAPARVVRVASRGRPAAPRAPQEIHRRAAAGHVAVRPE
jgi:pilus assembly protein CpaB